MKSFSLKGGWAILTLLTCSCAAKHAVRTEGVLPASCVRGEFRLRDCNFSLSPPCKTLDITGITYDPSCIRIEVKK